MQADECARGRGGCRQLVLSAQFCAQAAASLCAGATPIVTALPVVVAHMSAC